MCGFFIPNGFLWNGRKVGVFPTACPPLYFSLHRKDPEKIKVLLSNTNDNTNNQNNINTRSKIQALDNLNGK